MDAINRYANVISFQESDSDKAKFEKLSFDDRSSSLVKNDDTIRTKVSTCFDRIETVKVLMHGVVIDSSFSRITQRSWKSCGQAAGIVRISPVFRRRYPRLGPRGASKSCRSEPCAQGQHPCWRNGQRSGADAVERTRNSTV
jgi:hypothetical protein